MIDLHPDVQEALKGLARPGSLWPGDARDRILAQVRHRQRRRVAVGGGLTTGGVAAMVVVGVLVAGAPVTDRTSEITVATTTSTTAPTASATPETDHRSPVQRRLTLAEVKRHNRHALLLQPPNGVAQISREDAIRLATGEVTTIAAGTAHPVRAWLRTATTKNTGRRVNGHFQPEADHRLMWVVATQDLRVPVFGPIPLQGSRQGPETIRSTVVLRESRTSTPSGTRMGDRVVRSARYARVASRHCHQVGSAGTRGGRGTSKELGLSIKGHRR